MKNLFQLIFIAAIIFILLLNSNSFSQLSGNYTIGVGGNYTTIASAVSSLVTQGVNGPVIFNIKNGNYYEQITIDSIPGASESNTIIFQSESGDAADVNLGFNSFQAEYYIKIVRADYITFQKITFKDFIYNAYRTMIYLTGECKNIKIVNNIFSGTTDMTNPSIYGTGNLNNLLISGNQFEFYTLSVVSHAILLDDSSNPSFIRILNNSFNGFAFSIDISGYDSLLIEKNYIYSLTTEFNDEEHFKGIFVNSCSKYLKISKNKIVMDAQGSMFNHPFTTGILIENCISTALVYNNFIYNLNGEAINLYYSYNCKFFNNTITGSGIGFQIAGSNLMTIDNIIYTSVGPVYSLESSNIISDYNVFKDNVSFANYNGQNINLNQWIHLTGNDTVSYFQEVFFNSTFDLHLTGLSIGNPFLKGIHLNEVIDDIDGDLRDSLYPNKGADEVLSPTDAGIDLKVFFQGFYNSETDIMVRDTIKAYLRSTVSPYNVVDSSNGLAGSGGTNVNADALLRFFNAPDGSYYIVVTHRNSIETWSKNGGELLTGGLNYYNFSNAKSQAYGDNLVLKGTKYCIYSGDVNRDGIVDLSDVSLIDNGVYNFSSGYIDTDLDGNNFTDLNDFSIGDNNAYNFVSVIRP